MAFRGQAAGRGRERAARGRGRPPPAGSGAYRDSWRGPRSFETRPYNGPGNMPWLPTPAPFSDFTDDWGQWSEWDPYYDPFNHVPEDPPGFQQYEYDTRGSYTSYYGVPPQGNFPLTPPPATNRGTDDGHTVRLNRHPPTNGQRYRLFVTMLRCGEKVPDKTYLAMYWLGFDDHGDTRLVSPLFENDPGGHAEDRLLGHLEVQLDVVQKDRLKSVIILQNASPCSRCSENYSKVLEALLEQNSAVEVTIVFSSFHWIRRLSCRHAGHFHKHISKERHEENREGLRQLSQKGITVRTTVFEDWRLLCAGLQVPLPVSLSSEDCYQSSRRGKEDDVLNNDLKEILS